MKHFCFSLLSLFFAISPAIAMANDAYMDFSIGQTKFPGTGTAQGIISSVDDSDSSLTLTFGYKFNNYIAVQAGYYDFGEYSSTFRLDQPPFDQGPDATLSYEIRAYSVAVVPQYPISEKLSVFAELGMHSYSADAQNQFPSFENGVFDSMIVEKSSQDGEEFFYQAGLAYQFTDSLFTSIKYGQFDLDSDDFSNTSISIGINF